MVENFIRDVPDFPKAGILFKDITPLLQSPEGLKQTIDRLAEVVDPSTYDTVCGIESRGFIFGTALATQVGKGFVPIRKPGKLPWKTESESYELEYGTDTMCMHRDAIEPGQKVLMVDDLLATGGTMAACCRLVEDLGGEIVGCAFVMELSFLPGREALEGYRVLSLVDYKSEAE